MMKLYALAGLFVAWSSCQLSDARKTTKSDDDLKRSFRKFVIDYRRAYADEEEYGKRFDIFRENMEKVKRLNEKERGTATYGVTKFSDMTEEEFNAFLGYREPEEQSRSTMADVEEISDSDVPDSWDWRDQKAVTKVRQQGGCASCWAFSAVTPLETQWAVKTGKLISLSEQQLVDCDNSSIGCDGGWPLNAVVKLVEMGGLQTEADYPYKGKDRKCVFNKTAVAVPVAKAVKVPPDEKKMAIWVFKNGPLSVALNSAAMHSYRGGISHPAADMCDPKRVTHAVAIVGYGVEKTRNAVDGTERQIPFWIMKNSWGVEWGEKGYYRLFRGDNSCGVNSIVISGMIG